MSRFSSNQRTMAGESPQWRGDHRLEQLLIRIVDGSTAGCILLIPLLLGGAHPLGRLALVVLATVMAGAWALRLCQCERSVWRATAATPLLLGGVALVVLQIVPWPTGWLGWLSPHTVELLPLWNGHSVPTAQLGTWQTLSLTPAATRASLALLLAYAAVFLVTVQRIQRLEDVHRVLRWCAVSAVGVATLGLVQFFAGNGKLFWFYEHPYVGTGDAVRGSFVNRNHFADFLALGIGPLIWWMQDAGCRKDNRRRSLPANLPPNAGRVDLQHFLVAAVWIVLLAGLLSLSRGGMIAMALATAIVTAVGYWTASLGRKWVISLIAVAALMACSLGIFGYDRVSRRFEGVASVSLEQLDQGRARRDLWTSLLKTIPEFLVFGTGSGSHSEVYPIYLDTPLDLPIEYTHAENGYLQVALETGVPGLLLLLGGIGLCAFWCVGGLKRTASNRIRVCQGAIAASLAASAGHALVDFAWYMPGCMVVVAVLSACALRVFQLSDDRRQTGVAVSVGTVFARLRTVPWPLCYVALGSIVLAGAWLVADQFGSVPAQSHWNRYLLRQARFEAAAVAGDRKEGADPSNISDLESVVQWQPDHARAHLALAASYLRWFDVLQQEAENPMSLANLRDAATRSQFPSQQALDVWFSRVTGDRRELLARAQQHAVRALELCPLQGEGYVYLARLSFLTGPEGITRTACLGQALRVRPFDGDILFAAATEAWLVGDTTAWLDFLHRAFHSGRCHRETIVRDLLRFGPANGIPAMIEFLVREFQPEPEILRSIHREAQQRVGPESLIAFRTYFARVLEARAESLQGTSAALVWLEAQELYDALGQAPQAVECATRALQCDPGSFDGHYRLALGLQHLARFAEAEAHLRWCFERRPANEELRQRLREAMKGRLDGREGTTAQTSRDRR